MDVPPRKTILSFYCDDTGPYAAPAEAFGDFLDYCVAHRIAGESSVILGGNGRSMTREPDANEREYLAQVRRAYACGIDAHMEIMTHRARFDFASGREPEGAGHEGVWLYEPEVTLGEYEAYFAGIIAEGDRAGVKFTGITWPGCGCETCARRYAEMRAAGRRVVNPNVWLALLNLAKAGKFRGRIVTGFFDPQDAACECNLKARDGDYAVYDLIANAEDRFGIWENDPAHVNPDYYITADGSSGVVAERVAAGAPYCLFYTHWQGLNPGNGVGWDAFRTVIDRIEARLGDRVAWMRPGEIAAGYHRADERTIPR